MRSWHRLLFGSLLLALPLCASAKQSTVWNFQDVTDLRSVGQWTVTNWDRPNLTPEGLHIQTPRDGKMVRQGGASHRTDEIRLTFTHVRPTEALLLWHPRGTPADQLIQMPFSIDGQSDPDTVSIDLSSIPQWDTHTDKIGFALPAGADVTLMNITMIGYNPVERLWAGLRSFWTFDTFRAYTINFVWGPILRWTETGRQNIFLTLPPIGRSGNWVFYLTLACAACIIAVHWRRTRAQEKPSLWQRPLLLSLLVIAACWLTYDIRMGTEMISYAVHDVQTSILPPPEQRTFRAYEKFFTVVEQSLPAIQEQKHFAFVGPDNSPFISRMRYLAYPSIPVETGDSLEGVTTWLIFSRDDITVDDQGRLLQNGKVLVPSGKILERFSGNSFLYRSNG